MTLGNHKSEKVFIKDPTLRQTINISWDKAKSTIYEGLNNSIDTCTAKIT